MASATKALQTVCANRYTTPMALAAALDEATSGEWRAWLPEMLRDFIGLGPGNVQAMDKVMATQVALTNADLGSEWPLFLAVSSAFNHRRANFEWMDAPSYLELAWTCRCLRDLAPSLVLDAEVVGLLTTICTHEGVVYFPWSNPPVRVVDDMVSAWLAGVWEQGLKDTALSEVDEHDVRAVQAAKLVAGQEYIRACEHAGKS